MKKQAGFILPSPMMLLAGALALALLAAFIQTLRLDSEQKAFELFQVQTRAVGDAQEARTKAAEKLHREIVKEKDDENTIAHIKLADVSKRLRLSTRSGSGLVPPASPGASRPDLACYDRAELDAALRDFTGSTGELVIEGESATIDLNTGKAWVKALK